MKEFVFVVVFSVQYENVNLEQRYQEVIFCHRAQKLLEYGLPIGKLELTGEGGVGGRALGT